MKFKVKEITISGFFDRPQTSLSLFDYVYFSFYVLAMCLTVLIVITEGIK